MSSTAGSPPHRVAAQARLMVLNGEGSSSVPAEGIVATTIAMRRAQNYKGAANGGNKQHVLLLSPNLLFLSFVRTSVILC